MISFLRHLKKGDLILAGVLGAGFVLSLILVHTLSGEGDSVTVIVDGEVQQRLPLKVDQTVTVAGPLGETTLRISEDRVWIENAPCPHKTCMRMGKIHSTGQVIVCVPNRILLRIDGKRRSDVDAVTM